MRTGTPSTVCSSPQLHMRLASLADDAEPATEPRRTTKPLPFASLGLPAWAIEIAVNEPVDDDCDSWYYPSPRSAAASPRTFEGEVAFATPARRSPAPPSRTIPGASWADLMEDDDDDDSMDGWPMVQATNSGRSPSAPSKSPMPIASVSKFGKAKEGKVCWADWAEDEDTPDDVWMADVGCQSGKFTDGDASTDASDCEAFDHGSRCSSESSSPSLPTLAKMTLFAQSRAMSALPGLLVQKQSRKASWADLAEDEDDDIFDAWPALSVAADGLRDDFEHGVTGAEDLGL